MIETNAEGLHIQEKVVKAQAKFKIYEGLDQMLQKTEKVEVQEDKGISEHQRKHVRTVGDKTNYYNKNLKAYHQNGPKGIIWKRNENHEINTLREKALSTDWIYLLLKMGLSESEEG